MPISDEQAKAIQEALKDASGNWRFFKRKRLTRFLWRKETSQVQDIEAGWQILAWSWNLWQNVSWSITTLSTVRTGVAAGRHRMWQERSFDVIEQQRRIRHEWMFGYHSR
jgi:hypothetical protein